MSISRCPYCATFMSADPDADEGKTDDHVFWEVFGAHATVDACRRCNSRIGHDIEGKLSRGNELYTRGRWRGTTASDDPARPEPVAVDVDLEARDVRRVKPVTIRDEGNDRHFRLEGSRDQVKRVLKDGLGKIVGWSNDEVDTVVANTPGRPWHLTVSIDIVHNLNTARQLAAKMVLGAGTLADAGFATSDLADSLRQILWAELSPIQLVFEPALKALSTQLDLPGLSDRPLYDPTVSVGQAYFVPLKRDSATIVFARMNGHLVGGSGFVVPGQWPRANDLPVLVEDRSGGASVRFVVDDLLAWTQHNAVHAEQSRYPRGT
ncbi:hypothetical protein QWY28_23035 [Nocardioides sp. SOB77]|uniref:HNH endonuclease n=1 Tax=Nocardioides oceani TaxID=3058369 RepID=A0ABT8FMU9_9ACTN|nr:hypothetical protein [Nocardioides oceani]MDN4175850.1 hypothetical protein [Nocardioides oceani]